MLSGAPRRIAGRAVLAGLLALATLIIPWQREFVLATSQEFANYGDLGLHIARGEGVRTNLGQPIDLYYLRQRTGSAAPGPWPTVFRPIGPPHLIAALFRLFGVHESAIVAPAALGLLVTVVATVVLGEVFFGAWVGFLAALPLIAERPVLRNVFNAYPDCLFAAVMCLLFLVLVATSSLDRRRVPGALLVGLCGGLAQLSRLNFVIWSPLFVLFFALVSPGRQRVLAPLAFLLGLAVGGFPEWAYSLAHFRSPTRGLVALENLANIQYHETWLYYVPLDPRAFVLEHWRALGVEFVTNFTRLTLQCLGGVEGPTDAVGLAGRATLGALFLAGIPLAWRGTYPRALRHAYTLALVLLVSQTAVFAVLRGGERYFYWFIPLLWAFALYHGRLLLARAAELRGWPATSARRVTVALAVALVALMGGRIGGLLTGARAVDVDLHGFTPAHLEAIRDHDLPALRARLPERAVVASDRCFLLWYLGNRTVPLPLDPESFRAIERDYFPIDYIYLTGLFFTDAADYANYTAAYFPAAARVGVQDRLGLLLQQYPEFGVVERFADGGVLLERRAT